MKSVDVLVISSGLGIRAFNDETTPEVEKKMMQTNFMGPILLAKAVLPSMRKQHSGTVVFISSIQGLLAIPAIPARSTLSRDTAIVFARRRR